MFQIMYWKEVKEHLLQVCYIYSEESSFNTESSCSVVLLDTFWLYKLISEKIVWTLIRWLLPWKDQVPARVSF